MLFQIRSMVMSAAIIFLLTPLICSARPVDLDAAIVQQMQETVRQQQKLLDLQDEQLRQQSQNLESIRQQITTLQKNAPSPQAPAADLSATIATAAPPKTLTSGTDRVKLSISGQINRAVSLVDDGGASKLYHLDNNVSNSRIRFVGSLKISDDLQLGTRIELAVSPDNSSQVSQSNQAPGNYFNQRWAEMSLQSKTLGKLSLGKGDAASKGTVIQDLSRTDVVQYAGVSDLAAGMFFRKADSQHSLTTIQIGNAFNYRDGLGRQSRLRYDSPSLLGFMLAGSIVSGQRSDLALYWGGQGYGFRAVGAAAVANPRLSNSGLLYDGSFSLLHSASGLNLTVSGGIQKQTRTKDGTNFYSKLGWIADFTRQGYTAFGLDYTNSGNMPASNNRAWSVGAAVVQSFEKYATELYLQYRIYSLKQGSGVLLDDMQVSTLGVRVKF
jgi:predicted porin